MSKNLDIHEQYEQIFGKQVCPNIFSPDDEEYNSLRQEIRDAKREFNPNKKLPFENIILQSYEEFCMEELVQKSIACGKHIFFIKKYQNKKLVAFAAGYYISANSLFCVLKESFCQETFYFNHICENILIKKKLDLRDFFSARNGSLYLKSDSSFDSASLAASIFMGIKTTFKEWKDENEYTLDKHIPYYKYLNIDYLEEKTFPYVDIRKTKDITKNPVKDSIENLPGKIQSQRPSTLDSIKGKTIIQKDNTNDTNLGSENKEPVIDLFNIPAIIKKNQKRHLFYLKPNATMTSQYYGVGYYDSRTRKFHILSGSLLNITVDHIHAYSQANIRRLSILEKQCTKTEKGYIANQDIECETPQAASFYITGTPLDGWRFWLDSDNKTLQDVYRNFELL